MALKVIQWATGNVGTFSLRVILGHPELELVGLIVHGEDKEGRDAGSFCDAGESGIRASRNIDEILGLDADCVCYSPYPICLQHFIKTVRNFGT